jgi:tetratricopeptide (TPR) repeat protein
MPKGAVASYVLAILCFLFFSSLTAQEPAQIERLGAGREVELVDKVVAARRACKESLENLKNYYIEVGQAYKESQVEQELQSLRLVHKPEYILLVDRLPLAAVPAQHIPAADELYTDAKSYKDYPDLFTKKNRLIVAIQKFKEIIEKYPTSDKADDAAFRLGEIYEGFYFRDYHAAAKYYEACFRWNPNTEYPARLEATKCHYKHTKNFPKAAELYKEAMENSPLPENRLEGSKKSEEMRDRGLIR